MVHRVVESADGAIFDWARIQSMAPDGSNPCYLVALDERQILLLYSLLRYAEWPARWVNYSDWDTVDQFVTRLEHCLMSGCSVQQLIKVNRMLVAAITGQVVDLDSELPDGVVDFSTDGLAVKFVADSDKNIADVLEDAGDQAHLDQIDLQTAISNLETALGEVKTAVEGIDTSELEDDLANVWDKIQDIAEILGATVGPPPTPL